MPSSSPPRKFAPTPIEQTTKSSRQPATSNNEEKKPRRFAPEPIEETVKSSKDAKQPEKPKPRRWAPEPSEHMVKKSKDPPQNNGEQAEKPKPRRFAVEPAETTVKSSKDRNREDANDKPRARRFEPQVVEETHKSTKDRDKHEQKGHVKFKPELVSSEQSSRRNGKHADTTNDEGGDDSKQKSPPRRFTPILLDTATRSRRAGDPNAPLSLADRTEYAYHLHPKEHWKRVTGPPSLGNSDTAEPESEPEPADPDAMDIDDVKESNGSPEANHSSQARREVCIDGSPPSKRSSCLKPARQHSYHTPDLDTIDSSESEPDSNPSPMSTSPGPDRSHVAVPDSTYEYFTHATRIRESVDENFANYMLDLQRKNMQRQELEEQALAAFPNPDFGYEPPDHYINNDDDEDIEIEDRPVTFDPEDVGDLPRRESTAKKMSWEQLEAQKAAELAQQERNANKVTNQPASPFAKFPAFGGPPNAEIKAMRDRARPPMLGAELVFPRSTSPEPARFDVTQGSSALRNQLNQQEAANADKKPEEGGLWGGAKPENKRLTNVKTTEAKKPEVKGLWGGFCAADDDTNPAPNGVPAPRPRPTGLETPKQEKLNPFDLLHPEGRQPGLQTPSTPVTEPKESDMRKLNDALATERDIDRVMAAEFPDSFITQVYNYLSLGYPSLARPFDEELAKISKIPIAELREDDAKARAAPRGYIRLGADFEGGGGEGLVEGDGCVRWRALKLYVREWARQEKDMVKGDLVGGNWGTGARRGSWAI